MKREELVKGLKQRLIDSTIEEYKRKFDESKVQSKLSNNQIETIEFYQSLTEKEKEVFFKIIRQIEVDTVADFFAFLDGSYWLEGQTEDMKLISLENPEEKLNEGLTDIFLNLEYKWDR